MAVLNKGNWKAPFLGKSNDYSTGRDALGLQTTSQASYSTLLPGLTNLTNRIRYYGFYCWLLEVYASHVGDTNPKNQNRFIRRGEYMIALLMELHENTALQIPGSLFAAEEVHNNENEEVFDLTFGADIKKDKTTYWKYSSGAFGQYYSGAMQTMGLIIHRDDSSVFICTKHDDDTIVTGTLLANAFAANISTQAKELFIENIEKGELKISDSKNLFTEFSITDIPKNSEEFELYSKAIFSNDQPLFQNADQKTYFRKDSFLSVLSFIKEQEEPDNWDFFTNELYNRKGIDFNGIETKSSFGWYYYQLNEYWHYGVETMFWSVLKTLSGDYFQVQLSKFLDDFYDLIIKSLIDNGLIHDGTEILGSLIDSIEIEDAWEISEEISKSIKEINISKAVYLGFKMLIIIYKENNHEFDKLRDFAAYNGMVRDGNCINGLMEFEYSRKESISDTVKKFLLKNIINRHLEIAYRKMGSGVKNTLKFSYEDNFIKYVDIIEPVWTTPRIYAMYNFLKDLGYVNEDGSISIMGNQMLKS